MLSMSVQMSWPYMKAVPEVGGNIPVKIDLSVTHAKIKRNQRRMVQKFPFHLSCIIHGGGLPRSIVAQEGGNLTLVEADAETIHSGSLAAAENLDQVLDDDAFHQVGRLCFEERVAWTAQIYNLSLSRNVDVG